MRHTTKIGIAIASMLIVAAMAAVDVPAAAAKPTVLCVVNEDPCPKEKTKPKNSELYGYASSETTIETELELVSELGSVECAQGKLVIRTGEPKLELLTGEAFFVFASCSYGESACVAEPGKSGYPAFVKAVGEGNGTFSISEPSLQVSCAFGKCVYGVMALGGEISGGATAEMRASGLMSKLSGPFTCPGAFTYQGVFEDIQSPTYVSHG